MVVHLLAMVHHHLMVAHLPTVHLHTIHLPMEVLLISVEEAIPVATRAVAVKDAETKATAVQATVETTMVMVEATIKEVATAADLTRHVETV